MDESEEGILAKAITREEIQQIPKDVCQKLKKFFETKFEELIVSKALGDAAKNSLDEIRERCEGQTSELTSKIQDYEAKLLQSEQLINELRIQLDSSQNEVSKLLEATKRYESEAEECRRQMNIAVDERDSLRQQVQRRNNEIENLKCELKSTQEQLKNAITAKCEAITKASEIQSKEDSLNYKEQRMEKERIILHNQIRTLTEDLNRNIAELQTIRRDNTVHILELKTKLEAKTDELNIVNSTNIQLRETVDALTAKSNDLANKLLAQNSDSTKMMEHYKKELHAQSKLAELYKENEEDHKAQIDELTANVSELRKALNDATSQYGELETRLKAIELKHEQELDEKNSNIESLKNELKHANELLNDAKQENIESAIEKLAPTAAVTKRLLKSDMSLTELYTLYVKATEEVQFLNKTNAQLKLQMNDIMDELSEKAPIIAKKNLEYERILQMNDELNQKLENYVQEQANIRLELQSAESKIGFLEREITKLKSERSDLSHQVCYLVAEIEKARGGFSYDSEVSISSDMSANEVISKKLVTFRGISELQENNIKLLTLVRDLSTKLEEMEEMKNNIDQASYEAKLESYSRRLQEMQELQQSQSQMLTTCTQQREKYKKLYFDSLKASNKSNQQKMSSMLIDGITLNDDEGPDDEITQIGSNNGSVSDELIAEKNKRISELEEKVTELQKQIKLIKEEHENYRKEKLTNDKMLNEQFDSMRTEIRELTSTNCKLMSTVEFNNEQIKIQQQNTSVYKKQISTLEQRNKNYENTIVKHEQTLAIVRNEALKAQEKLSSAEVQLENLKHECRLLRDSEARLQMEREILHRERQSNSLVLNNLEMIKASFERSETEGRQRLESRLDDAQRECSMLRRRQQEEADRFREMVEELKQQTDTAKERMEQEKAAADKLRLEMSSLRDEIAAKSEKINELSKKLQESLTPSRNDNPIAQANKKAKEAELKLSEVLVENESLKKELKCAREHGQQYCKISQGAEKELKELHDIYTEYKTKCEAELNRLQTSESNLKSRVEELETEIRLQITGAELNSGNSASQIGEVKTELKKAHEKLLENNREMRNLRNQVSDLRSSLQEVEQKYANEMSVHTSDIQELAKTKGELTRIREQIDEFKMDRDRAVDALEETKKAWTDLEEKLKTERDELEKRLTDMNAQNAFLHDQIETLSSKVALSHLGGGGAEVQQKSNESLNDSTVLDSSLVNRSITEEESKNNDQLLQIIKYLRKEKDIAIAKVDILKSENARIISEQDILRKKIKEYQESLNNERTKSESTMLMTSKHEELLRKIETLNAMTDSNRILREERDILLKRVEELSERVTAAQDELFPLQDKNRELLSKIEETNAETISLRAEAIRWRNRATTLLEKSNKNPEDFKRLQHERESLAKLLSAEKESLKQVQEELQTVKNEKSKLESEINNLGRQIQVLTDEKKKITDDFNMLKQQNVRLNHEIMEMKNQLLQKEEELRKVNEELSSKDAQLADSKNKENQIRKIAKRYKDSFFELKNKEEGRIDGDNPGDGDSQQGGEPGPSAKQELEKELKEKINELNVQNKSIQEENEVLKKEIVSLETKEDKTKTLLKEAKARIVMLNESKSAISKELHQKDDEYNLKITAVKSQWEAKVVRLEKELTDQNKEMNDTISRLTQEKETLLSRLNQLHRTLGMQQSSKPSTSSSSGSDKGPPETPRTANVKPMSGPSGQQSATVTPWRGGDTPLASIRPMSVQNSRTAAVLPTSQTSSISTIQGSSSGSVTALVPPQQQVHTTGNSLGEAISSSPTSSHTDYMPATSSAAVVVAAIPPMGTSAESSQEAESIPTQNNESSSTSQIIVSGGQQQQAVALVSPRVEGTQSIVAPPAVQSQETNQPSTSGSSSSSSISVSSHHQASSSSTVTTTQAGHKRPRDVEGDSSTSIEEPSEKSQPQNKRTRMQTGEAACQGVSESGIEVEYQVPTSSQRDQEDDIIIVDSEEDDGMPDEGNVDADDGPMEDDVDEIEESYEQEQDIDEGEGPDIDEDNVQSDNNEVEVDDSSEVPNQSGAASSNNQVAPDAVTSQVVDQSTSNQESEVQNQGSQQIQTISSGSDASFSAQVSTQSGSWRQATPLSRQQQATLLMLQQGYEEGDDSIVPSTPTLYVPRRADGFSEAVSSPHPQVPHAARFTFSDASRQIITPAESIDDVRADISDEVGGRGVPSTPQQTSPQRGESTTTVGEGTSSSTEKNEQLSDDVQDPIAGPSNLEGSVPEITVTTANDEEADMSAEGATTSDVQDVDPNQIEEIDIEEEGLDGVTSEGEKASAGTDESNEVEEGREAEASTTPSINTRSRSATRVNQSSRRNLNRSMHARSGGRPTPIIWQDSSRSGAGNRNMPANVRPVNEAGGSSSRTSFQMQRARGGARRIRRGAGSNYGGNMRY